MYFSNISHLYEAKDNAMNLTVGNVCSLFRILRMTTKKRHKKSSWIDMQKQLMN